MIFERLIWVAILTSITFYLTSNTLRQLLDVPTIVTQISLRSLDLVPFPAILVNTGGPIDPMGFIRNSGDMLGEGDVPEKGSLARRIAYFS